MPCARGRINNWNWVEATRPVTDLRAIHLALQELNVSWTKPLLIVKEWNEIRQSLAQNLDTHAEIQILKNLATTIEEILKSGKPEITLSNGFKLSWNNGSYRIGSNSGGDLATFSAQLNQAYLTYEKEISEELEGTIKRIEDGRSNIAVEHTNALRTFVEIQKKAIANAKQNLIEERMNHIETVGNELGYAVRKQQIGKKIKYVLVRQP
tara:strand:+ start:11450 stop:12076 length:627 start_codon:yes stop_codon:yes gene_type:complete